MDDAGLPARLEGQQVAAPSLRRPAIVGSVWVLVGKTVSTLAGFAVSALLARLLSPEEFGSYFLASTIVMVGATVAQLGLRQTTVRLIAEAIATGRTDQARAATRVILRLSVMGAVIVGGILALGIGRLIAEHVFGSALLADVSLLVAAWVVSLTIQQVLAEVFRGLQDLRFATIFEGLISGTLSAAAFAALSLSDRDVGLAVVVGVSVLASLASVILAALLVRRRIRTMEPGGHLRAKPVLAASWPFLVTGIVLFAVTAGTDLWIIGAFRGENDVALYGAAGRLIGLMVSPMLILLSVAPPFIAALNIQGERGRLEQAIRGATGLVALPCLIAFVALLTLSKVILTAVYGPYYAQAGDVTMVLSIGYLITILAGPCGLTLMMTGHQKTMMKITIASGVLSVAGGLSLVRPLGIIGVAWSTTAGLVLQNALTLWAVRRHVGIWTHADFSPRAIRYVLGLSLGQVSQSPARHPE